MYQKIKSYLIILLAVVALSSCSEYNKVLNKGTGAERYNMANALYNKGEFSKAARLYDLILPQYMSKPQAEAIMFRLADASYNIKDYLTAIHYYERYIRVYPKSIEIEKAQYRVAESYYQMAPKYSVTQEDTEKALEAFQNFIDANPDSEKIKDANQRIKELNLKFEKKAFEIAKQYYKIGYYKSAIVAFDNVILDHLGTSYKEEAMLYKFKSAYELGMNSVYHKKAARIQEAIKAFDRYKKTFPKSEYLKEAENLQEKLLKEEEKIKIITQNS